MNADFTFLTPEDVLKLSDADLARYADVVRELKRIRAQETFYDYYELMTGFTGAPHHRLTCRLLQNMEMDIVDRAMVFMPPRHAKTLLCSHLHPSWVMGRNPTTEIMAMSHTQRYARSIGSQVRRYMRSDKYPFNTQIAHGFSAKDQWATSENGKYNAFGLVGGSTHGNPASWLYMDDIIKGRKMALSPHMREEAWETYKLDMLTRLQDRRKQLMVFTRWNQDDPAGRILPEDFDGKTGWYKDRETGEKWFVLCLAARCEHDKDPIGRKPGEWLWPEKFGDKELGPLEKRGGWMWSALYQQRPSPEEGLFFLRDHFQWFDMGDILQKWREGSLSIYGASDYAVTQKADQNEPDWTVHMVFGVDANWNIYVLDMWRDRTTSDKWVEAWIRLVTKWKPMMWAEEQGQIIKGVGPFLSRMAHENSAFTHRRQFTSATAKDQRAQSILGMAASGLLYLPRNWIGQMIEKECLAFPAGKNDDMVDTLSLMGRMLMKVISGTDPEEDDELDPNSLEALFRAHGRGSMPV